MPLAQSDKAYRVLGIPPGYTRNQVEELLHTIFKDIDNTAPLPKVTVRSLGLDPLAFGREEALCTLQIGFLRFPHTTETRQLGYFQIIQYLQHKKDIFGFLMYQKSLILGYFPIIKIAAVHMALIRPIRRRK